MNNEQLKACRDAFEIELRKVWPNRNDPYLRDCNDVDPQSTYQDPDTEFGWIIWQAAWEQSRPAVQVAFIEGYQTGLVESEFVKPDSLAAWEAWQARQGDNLIKGLMETIESQKQTHDALLKKLKLAYPAHDLIVKEGSPEKRLLSKVFTMRWLQQISDEHESLLAQVKARTAHMLTAGGDPEHPSKALHAVGKYIGQQRLVITSSQALKIIETYLAALPPKAGDDEWELGAMYFHRDTALREDLDHVFEDCKGFITDLLLNDIQLTMRKHGYDMRIYKQALSHLNKGDKK